MVTRLIDGYTNQAEDGRYEFLFTALPEPFTGGCSAPVAPIATR